jgi:hypothetical protein
MGGIDHRGNSTLAQKSHEPACPAETTYPHVPRRQSRPSRAPGERGDSAKPSDAVQSLRELISLACAAKHQEFDNAMISDRAHASDARHDVL